MEPYKQETVESAGSYGDDSKSGSIAELCKALVKFQTSMSPVSKNEKNPHMRNKYASLDHIWESTRIPLGECGLAVTQTMSKETSDGCPVITTTLMHVSGQWVRGSLSIPAHKVRKDEIIPADAQSYGSAITYGRRYSLCAILGIVTGDDDDGNIASGKGATKPVDPLNRDAVTGEAREALFEAVKPHFPDRGAQVLLVLNSLTNKEFARAFNVAITNIDKESFNRLIEYISDQLPKVGSKEESENESTK